MEPRRVSDRFLPDILTSTVSARSVWAVVGDWEAGRFLLPEIDLCGSPLTLVSGSLDQAEDPAVNHETLPYQVVRHRARRGPPLPPEGDRVPPEEPHPDLARTPGP